MRPPPPMAAITTTIITIMPTTTMLMPMGTSMCTGPAVGMKSTSMVPAAGMTMTATRMNTKATGTKAMSMARAVGTILPMNMLMSTRTSTMATSMRASTPKLASASMRVSIRMSMLMARATPTGMADITVTGRPLGAGLSVPATAEPPPEPAPFAHSGARAGAARDAAGEPSPGEGAALGLLPLFAWLSPAFPVGAYAYSHALEWAVEAGDVATPAQLLSWLEDVFAHGFARTDAILLAHAHAATCAADGPALREVNELAVALAPSAELRLETCQQGRSFLDAVSAAWLAPRLAEYTPLLVPETAYAVVLGLAGAAHGMALAPVLEAFLLGLAQNLVSAAVRLAPIGQTAGTKVVAALAPRARALAAEVPLLTLDDIGSATFRADLGSFRHETQYTRLFRS